MTETALLRNLTYIKNYKNSVIWGLLHNPVAGGGE